MPAGPCGPEIRTAMPGRRLAPPPCRPTREEGGSTDGLGAGLPLIGAAMPGRRRHRRISLWSQGGGGDLTNSYLP